MKQQETAPSIVRRAVQQRRGIIAVSRRLGITYPHLYRCLRWLNGDTIKGRKPGQALEASIRADYPELVERGTPGSH